MILSKSIMMLDILFKTKFLILTQNKQVYTQGDIKLVKTNSCTIS